MRTIRHLNHAQRQSIEHDLTLTRIGELDVRNLEVLARGLLAKPSGTVRAVLFEGWTATPGAGLSVDLAYPFVGVQQLGADDVQIAIEGTTGQTRNIPVTAADPINPRIDIIVARVNTRLRFTDPIAAFADPALNTITTASTDRDREYYVETDIVEGSPAPSPTAPAIPDGTAAIYTGTVAIAGTIDLSSKFLLSIAIGEDGEFIEVDCQGAAPAATTLAEIVTAINTAFGSTIADIAPGNFLRLTAPNTGRASVLRIKQPEDSTQDAADIVLGLTISSRYMYRYIGANPWFKIAEVFVPALAVSLTAGNVRSIEERNTWSADANTIAVYSSLQGWQDQKDALDGYVGKDGHGIRLRNNAGTIDSYLRNTNTGSREYTLPDESGELLLASKVAQTFVATAGENLLKGDLVGVSNGKVWKYHEWRSEPLAVTTNLLTPSGTVTTGTIHLRRLSNDGNKGLLIWSQTGNAIYGAVIEVSGSTVTAGTPVNLFALPAQIDQVRVDHYSGSQYMMTATTAASAQAAGRAIMISISGTTLSTVGTDYSARNTGYVARWNTDEWIMAYSTGGQTLAYVLTWNPGTSSFSAGSGVVVDGAAATIAVAYKVSSTEFIWHKNTGSMQKYTVTGTSIAATGAPLSAFWGPTSSDAPNDPTYWMQSTPFVIKNGSEIYIGGLHTGVTPGDDLLNGSATVWQYRRLNIATMTFDNVYWYDEIGNPIAHHPDSGWWVNASAFSKPGFNGTYGFLYDTDSAADYDAFFNTPDITGIAGPPEMTWVVMSIDKHTTPGSMVFAVNSVTDYNNIAGAVIGSTKQYAVAISFDGTNLDYTLYRVYRPANFAGICNADVLANADAVVLKVGAFELAVAEPQHKGKYLQIWNGEIFPSYVAWRAIGVHSGTRYQIGTINNEARTSNEVATYSDFQTASGGIQIPGQTIVMGGSGWVRISDTTNSGDGAAFHILIDRGDGVFVNYPVGWLPRYMIPEFFVPNARWVLVMYGPSGIGLRYTIRR